MRTIPAWVWLAIAAVLLLFANAADNVAIAAWLGPILLLRAVRMLRPLPGLLLALVVLAGIWPFQFRGMVPAPPLLVAAILGTYALLNLVPYAADRLAASRLPGLASTLVFPTVWVAVEFLLARYNPYGSWGATAYSQWGRLEVMQVASVTGLAGVTFLIGWIASTVNWAWERDFNASALKQAWVPVGVVALVILLGGLRLALSPPSARTVRVASFSRPESSEFPTPGLESAFESRTTTPAQQHEIDEFWRALADRALAHADREAGAGAQIVFWSEADLPVWKKDEPALVARGQQLAARRAIYLGMAIGAIDPESPQPLTNEFVLVTPGGEIAWRYLKARPVPGGEMAHSQRGDGLLRTLDTPFGRIGAAICFDMDFPDLLAQAGRAGAEIVLVPASDWRAIDPWHTEMAAFRGLEQGFSMVRQTRQGRSMAVDFQGHVLGNEDDFSSSDHTMVTDVPVRGTHTLYRSVGDLFSWLCVAGSLVLLAASIARRNAGGKKDLPSVA